MCTEYMGTCNWYAKNCDIPIPNNGARGSCGLMLDGPGYRYYPAQDPTECTPVCNAGYTLSGNFKCYQAYISGLGSGTLGGLTGGKCLPQDCDLAAAFTLPDHATAGTCTGASLNHSQSCEITCASGYVPSGKQWCQAGTLQETPVCNPNSCDDYQAPSNGYFGTCKSTLNSGNNCTVSCEQGYYPTIKDAPPPPTPGSNYGAVVWTHCEVGQITADAVCSAKGCDATRLPANAASLGTCVGYSITGSQGWLTDGSSCNPVCATGFELLRSATCSKGALETAICALPGAQLPQSNTDATCDASNPPTSGTVGSCTAQLASGSECTVSCNQGYRPSKATTCSNGNLQAGTCNAIMSGEFTLTIPLSTFGTSDLQGGASTPYKRAFIKATAEMTNLQEHQIEITWTTARTARRSGDDSCAFANDGECDSDLLCAPGTDSTDCGNSTPPPGWPPWGPP